MIKFIRNLFSSSKQQCNIPVIRHSKIDNYKEALEYYYNNENGTMDELRTNLTDEMINRLATTGMINI